MPHHNVFEMFDQLGIDWAREDRIWDCRLSSDQHSSSQAAHQKKDSVASGLRFWVRSRLSSDALRLLWQETVSRAKRVDKRSNKRIGMCLVGMGAGSPNQKEVRYLHARWYRLL